MEGGGCRFGSAPPEPVPLPSLARSEGAEAAAALRALREEIASVGALPFVDWADPPELMGAAARCGELFTPSDATGPWVVRAAIHGPPGGPYDAVFQVQLKADAQWPRSPAEARFCSSLHHPAVDARSGAVRPGALSGGAARAHSLAATLRRLRRMLARTCGAAEAEENGSRLALAERYRPLRRCPLLWDEQAGWPTQWLHTGVAAAVREGGAAAWRALAREEMQGVYSFPLFTEDCCRALLAELDSFEGSGLPARRPNSMNRYGVIVNDIGLEGMMTRLQREYLAPLAAALFPGPGTQLDRHHAFAVRYKVGEDLGLDMHTDDSEVTFNVCLGRVFAGSGLQFCGLLGRPEHRRASTLYRHEPGRCVVHLGRLRHGADDISAGERVNLIVWNRSSEYRRTREYDTPLYSREGGPPDRVCLSYTHDRDYGVFCPYSERTAPYRGKGWCPPPHAEYGGFREEG
eukprot:TRINITY_DN13991_c0_g1_i2.p1 TRINITY_DN13991_c0_g1~~TRINITY_DN13991_c0_g1_i2.p1  ORF type:complete len:488 (+),score=150.41 TRINITY_DN13991_c0_g1_i2:80-1465(+)